MYQSLLTNPNFYQVLLQSDREIAALEQAKGCLCEGILHQSNYPRKPRGLPQDTDPSFCIRFSFCCNQEGCRKRVTPPSLRFLGRKVYTSVIIVLVFTLATATSKQIDRLLSCIGVSPSEETLRRWRKFWVVHFPSGDLWNQQGLNGLDKQALPIVLLDQYAGHPAEKLKSLLKFLSPI